MSNKYLTYTSLAKELTETKEKLEVAKDAIELLTQKYISVLNNQTIIEVTWSET